MNLAQLLSIKAKGLLPAKDPKVNYMGPEKSPFKCGNCMYFIKENAPCKKVVDPVKAEGCCNLFDNEQ